MSCHARTTDQLNDRTIVARVKDAEQKKRPAAAPWQARGRNRHVISPRRLIADRGSWYVSRRVREALRCELKRVPHQARCSSCRTLAEVRGLVPGRGCCSPSSLPEPVHEPAMSRLTAVPRAGTRSAPRGALHHANSLPSSTPVRGACLDRGRGEVERVTTTSFSSDPETGAGSAAVRASRVPRTKLAARLAGCLRGLVLRTWRPPRPPRCLSPSTKPP